MSIPAFTDVAKASNDVSTFITPLVNGQNDLLTKPPALEQGLLPRIVGFPIML